MHYVTAAVASILTIAAKGVIGVELAGSKACAAATVSIVAKWCRTVCAVDT